MQKTPTSLRLHIGLFGRTNVGKSTFLNRVAGQDVAITSPEPGTTTDPVEKTMELPPLGPVVFIDTGGVDDETLLGESRRQRMRRTLRRSDVAVLVVESEVWTEHEDRLAQEMAAARCPLLVVISKTDVHPPSHAFMDRVRTVTSAVIESSMVPDQREDIVRTFKEALHRLTPERALHLPAFYGGAVAPGGLVLLMVPLDQQAPKGRLILPQVQAIRAALDGAAMVLVVTDRDYLAALAKLAVPPDLVVCDSQVVERMVAETPPAVPCTTFSILLARLKGDLPAMVRAARVIDTLRDGDRILIGEACSHHALEDDIGRQKIPRWLREKTGKALAIDVVAGRDWPADLEQYRLVIHCGACMINRREMRYRLESAADRQVPVSNYGVVISLLKGVLPRVLSPFPKAVAALHDADNP